MSYYLQGLGAGVDLSYMNNAPKDYSAPVDPDWKGPAPKPVVIFDPGLMAKQPTLFNAAIFAPKKDDQPAATLPPDDEGVPTWMIAAGVGALALAIAAGVVVMKKKRKDSPS